MVVKTAVLLYIMMTAGSTNINDRQGKTGEIVLPTSSIVGTTDKAKNSTYPYVVDIVKNVDGKLVHHCAGSILTHSIILTTCHCLAEIDLEPEIRSPKNYSIVAGTTELHKDSTTRQVRNIKRFTVHGKCNYIGITVANDVGIVELEDPLDFNHNVKPVSLYSKDIVAFEKEYDRLTKTGAVCDSPGWGHRFARENGTRRKKLQSGKMKLINITKCAKMFCDAKFRPEALCQQDFHRLGQICAASENGISPCHGDSGGPLICNGALFGVVSWGGPCTPQTPEVYASPKVILDLVDNYLPRQHIRTVIKSPGGRGPSWTVAPKGSKEVVNSSKSLFNSGTRAVILAVTLIVSDKLKGLR